MQALTRRSFICGSAAVATLTALPAVAATGVKTVGGKTQINLKLNPELKTVGGVVELSIKKYFGKVAVVRTSKSAKGFSVFSLACPHIGVTVQQDGAGRWICKPPGHGSEFKLNGEYISGVANSSLSPIKFVVKNNLLII